MAPNTALCLLLLGSAVVTLDLRTRRGRSPAAVLALCAGAIAVLAIFGYALAILSMYRIGQYIAMAVNTGIGVLALSTATLCARPSEGPVATIIRSWSLEKTIISGFAICLVMLCLIGVGAYQSMNRLTAVSMADDAIEADVLNAADLLSSIKDAETGQRGFLLTGDTRWLDRLIDWTDAWIKRGVTEPDGYVGWPKVGAAGTDVDNLDSYHADNLLGEAMALAAVCPRPQIDASRMACAMSLSSITSARLSPPCDASIRSRISS